MTRWAMLSGFAVMAAMLPGARTWAEQAGSGPSDERLRLYAAWHAMPAPPITPYSGPFVGEARAFIGKLSHQSEDPKVREAHKAFFDWKRLGTYDPAKDPRKINRAFEAATLEDWKRMGYNCAYKGHAFTYRSGRWLKKHGLLGAIDQTTWAVRADPPLSHDGKPGNRHPEACGSFFVKANFDAGVNLLYNYVTHFGDLDMLKVGGTYITSSWDEVGLRTRSMIDYRPEALAEYRAYLKDVWFQDASPGADTNRDGRTYNAFTGEKIARWDQVRPPALSPKFYRSPQPGDQKWSRPGAFKLWVDFHRYYTFEFFRRVNAAASRKLGRRVECYPFPIAFIIWPGANAHWGLSSYWNCRLNPIVMVEQCWPDSPAMSINYAITDRLARKFKNVVMGWSWFYFGKEALDMYSGPYDNGRALARMMGHRVDGIHHWLYSPIYRGRDRRQRKQIAYWHNFLGAHYRTFLSESAPPPAKIALLMPDWTGYFYRQFMYPKQDWAYTSQALDEAQYHHDIITEEELELEADALKPYKALYVVGCEWTTPTIRRRIAEFIKRGGYVYANCDSLTLDIPTGKRTDFLEKHFGVKITRKYKNSFLPSAQTPEEEAWAAALNGWGKPAWLQGHHVHRPGAHAKIWKVVDGKVVRDGDQWTALDKAMAKMPKAVRGLPQEPLDMRAPPQVTYCPYVSGGPPVTAWGEICIGEEDDEGAGTGVAWLGDVEDDRICGVMGDRTLWLGTRPGMSLHAISPRMSLNRPTEPCNPYVTNVPKSCEAHRRYVEIIMALARWARVKRLVTVRRDGEVPCNLEVLPRVDAAGNLMVFVINHDATEATYQVTIDAEHLKRPALRGAEAWDLLAEKLIEKDTDGRFDLPVPAWKAAVFLIGNPKTLAAVKQAQRRLSAMDLSVPKYFLDRPHLNQGEWHTPVPEE